MGCDQVIIVGSGLADLHLNTWLEQARKKRNPPALLFVDRLNDAFFMEFDHTQKSMAMLHTLAIKDLYEWHPDKMVRKHEYLRTYPRSNAHLWSGGFSSFLRYVDAHQDLLNMTA
jgi:hypothetical protein